MSFYDEENPLLLQRPRPFWEEEEPVVPPVVVQPSVAPPPAPPPEVEGPGYASLEDIPADVQGLVPEVEGPGYASLEDIPGVKEAVPEVEGPGYTSLEEILGAEPPSLGDAARVGYRMLAAPLLEPVETARRVTEAVREGLVVPEGTRRAEFVNRIKRNFATGTEETKAGTRQMAAGLLSAEQNPYVGKSVAEAKADIPLLEQQIAETEKSLSAAGGDPSLSGMEWYYETAPENRGQSQKLTDLRTQLMRAKETATGVTTESFAGALSRSFGDVAQENRARQAEIIKEYGDRINESHNKELWMQVADSLGSSAPSMGASILNPLFGLGLMYSQTFENSRSEFLEKGGDPAKADEYGHAQAALQTPLEILGELPIAGIARGALKRLVKEGSPESWAKWIKESAVEFGKAFTGEVGITTPGQTVIEQKLGEQYGIKPVKTGAELAADVWEAQKVAALQVGIAGGGPLAVEAGVRGVGAVSAVAPPAVVPPGAPAIPPAIPPTPPEAFAPPGVTITPAPGEVPVPPDLSGAAAPPVTPPVVPSVEVGPDSAAKTVAYKVQSDNAKVAQVADTQAQNLQASAAPKTAQAIQQVAQASNTEASVTAAEFLAQAQRAATEGVPPVAAAGVTTGTTTGLPPGITIIAHDATTGAPIYAGGIGNTTIPPAVGMTVHGVGPTAAAHPGQIVAMAPDLVLANGVHIPQVMVSWGGKSPVKTSPGMLRFPPGTVPVAPTISPPTVAAPAGDERFAPPTAPVAPEAAPAPVSVQTTPAVVVGGQVFTGDTHADAVQAAYAAVGPDAMRSQVTGWVDEGGRFTSHETFDTYQDLNTAMEGGEVTPEFVQEAEGRLAQAQARDTELNNQIVQPGGEQVVTPGIKGQEALISVRPSQELAVPLAGLEVSVQGVTPDGQPTVARRSAAQALNESRNDKTALTILLDCLT